MPRACRSRSPGCSPPSPPQPPSPRESIAPSEPLSDAPSEASDDSQATTVAEHDDRELYELLLIINARVTAVDKATDNLLGNILGWGSLWTPQELVGANQRSLAYMTYVDSVQGTPPPSPRVHQSVFIDSLSSTRSITSAQIYRLARYRAQLHADEIGEAGR
jgi:hypothetical protein